jgi:acyl-coenzyme A synthetase/AMP-(fatty) acid ligase
LLENKRYYLTGDLATTNQNECFFFKGRNDFQVKIRGYRVELEELEALLYAHFYCDFCITPLDSIELGNYEAIGLLHSSSYSEEDIRKGIAANFPKYITVKKILETEIPRNVNGKVDRKEAGLMIQS